MEVSIGHNIFRTGKYLQLGCVFQQQSPETCLLKIPIASQSTRNSTFTHNDKGDAIRQPPLLVASLTIEPKRLLIKFSRQRNNLDIIVSLKRAQQPYRSLTLRPLREGIANLYKYRLCRD